MCTMSNKWSLRWYHRGCVYWRHNHKIVTLYSNRNDRNIPNQNCMNFLHCVDINRYHIFKYLDVSQIWRYMDYWRSWDVRVQWTVVWPIRLRLHDKSSTHAATIVWSRSLLIHMYVWNPFSLIILSVEYSERWIKSSAFKYAWYKSLQMTQIS